MKNWNAFLAFFYDATIAAATVSLAMSLRLGHRVFVYYPDPIFLVMMTCIFLVIALPVFWWFDLHRGLWSYASLTDLTAIVKASTTAVLAFLAVLYLLDQADEVPRSIPVIQWFLLIVLLGGARFAWRQRRVWGKLRSRSRRNPVPVLMLGISDNAEQFVRATRGPLKDSYRVVGFVENVSHYVGRLVHGVPVLGGVRDLPTICSRLAAKGKRPQRLILSDGSVAIDRESKRNLLTEAAKLGLTVARIPQLAEFKDAADEGERPTLRPVALEDLLGRPQTALNREEIDRLISDRVVLVTGAGGTIGSELSRQIAAIGPKLLVLLDFSEYNLYSIDIAIRSAHPDLNVVPVVCNIRDRHRVMRVFRTYQPDLVFHAAALKHVPMVEHNPAEGILTNVMGTRNLVDAAQQHRVLAMVQVSTDKAVNPTSMMGASKRLAEFYCQALDLENETKSFDQCAPRFMTVRFGNVLGSSGSVVPLFQKQLLDGGPLTVTHADMKRYFMTVREAVELVLQASAHGVANPSERGKICVLDMGDPIKIVDIARQMIILSGLRPDQDIKIEFTGLRPGEKLYEELFDAKERRLPTVVEGVQMASSQPINLDILRKVFDDLARACEKDELDRVRQLVGNILPSYQETIKLKTG